MSEQQTADRYLIVGLGNPGRDYEQTRHNIGFRIVDALAREHGLSFDKKQSRAFCADGTIAGQRVLIVKPMTYMNLSGEAVGSILTFYKIPLRALLVISDDMDVPLGTLRIRPSGSAGGQNGLRSIIQHLGTQEFARLRFGIGRPPGRMQPAAYVLQDFDKQEVALLAETMDRTLKAISVWLTDGLEIMMSRCNGNGEPPAPKPTKVLPLRNNPKPSPSTESILTAARLDSENHTTEPTPTNIPSDN